MGFLGPLFTRGAAGAVLTYWLNQRVARRKIPRLLLNIENVNYALSSRDEYFSDLKVSYKQIEYDNLILYNAKIKNVSTKSVNKSPFLITMSSHASIIDKSLITTPINKVVEIIEQEGQNKTYLWDAGELKPNDSAEIRLLLSPVVDVEWIWRGDDDVEITSTGREISNNIDREIRNLVAWMAMFIFLGGIPVFQGILQGVFVIISSPFIISFIIRIRSLFIGRKATPFNITSGHSSNIWVESGGKISVFGQNVSDGRDRK